MTIYLFIEGILIGLVVAVPVGPLGLLCINRALMLGPQCGFFSGLGVATADALAAGIAALSISLISGLFVEHQLALRLVEHRRLLTVEINELTAEITVRVRTPRRC